MAKIFNLKDVPMTVIAGRGTTYRLINEKIGAKRVGIIIVELEPGIKSTDIHYHEKREAAYIVLQGTATLTLNGTVHHLKPNTIVFIPPGDKHGITSTGEEGFKMIEVYSPLEPDRRDV